MPQQLRVHSGTVNIIACDIDGYPGPAVQALGDQGVANVTVVDSVLGASRYDTNGTKIQVDTYIVQASKPAQTAPDRVNLTLTRVQVDPAVEAAGGKSLRIGSSVLDQFTATDVTFTSGSGSPALSLFEDYPTLIGTGIASDEAFGTGTIKLSNTLQGVGIESGETFGTANIAYQVILGGSGIPSDEAFGHGGASLLGQLFGVGIPSSEAFGAGSVLLSNTLRGAGIPSAEAFGVGRLVRLLTGAGIASGEAFGVGTLRLVSQLLGHGIPSAEAFGMGTVAAERFLGGAGIPSAEAFGTGNVVPHLPGADAAPDLIDAGRVLPAGGVTEGTPLVATIGAWSGYPDSGRFVWSADDEVVRDSGFEAGLWSDTYTPTSSDVGKTISVQEATSNNIGPAPLAPSHGTVSVRSLPLAFVGADEVFGPMPSVADVWSGLQDTVRTWLPTYLRQRERLSGRAYGSLAAPRGWRVYTQVEAWEPGDQFPCCVIVAPGMPDALVTSGGIVRGRFELAVSIVVLGPDFAPTLTLAADYGAALRSMLSQHGSLGGISDSTVILGERYDPVPSEDERTIAAAELVLSVRLSGVALRGGGPSVPFPDPPPTPDPGGPVLGTVATTELDLERV